MDLTLLISFALALLILLIILAVFKRRDNTDAAVDRPQPQVRAQAGQNRAAPRRAVAVRNTRARLSAAVRQQQDSDNEEVDIVHEEENDVEFLDEKLGAKKRAKLEAKADRQRTREMEERSREDKKKRQELADEEREKQLEREKLEEAKRLEEEKRTREQKEREEHEEYLKMKEMFSVEEEGCEVADEDEERNLLQEFINYIKSMKVVVLEDLAAHFKLKTQNVIDRIQQLQVEGSLTGVLDDRGKFIFISQEELEAVAKFVKQRGRVSITDLAESSNQLINLTSSVNTVKT